MTRCLGLSVLALLQVLVWVPRAQAVLPPEEREYIDKVFDEFKVQKVAATILPDSVLGATLYAFEEKGSMAGGPRIVLYHYNRGPLADISHLVWLKPKPAPGQSKTSHTRDRRYYAKDLLGREAMNYIVNKIRVWEVAQGKTLLPIENLFYRHPSLEAPSQDIVVSSRGPLIEPKLRYELGDPFYVVQQSPNSTAGFSLYEVRPTGSELLLQHKGVNVVSYGLTGFRFEAGRTVAESFVVLDDQKIIRKFDLASKSSATLSGEYQYLEAEAERTLFAVDTSLRVVEIFSDGKVVPVAQIPHQTGSETKIVDMHRAQNGALRILTGQNQLYEFDHERKLTSLTEQLPKKLGGEPIVSVRIWDDAVWLAQKSKLTRFEPATGRTQSIDLQRHYQKQNERGGQEFRFLGADAGKVYVRIGNHIYTIESPEMGGSLTASVLESSFFSSPIRGPRAKFELVSRIQAIQPRTANRKNPAAAACDAVTSAGIEPSEGGGSR